MTMPDQPLVSILTPTYNSARYLEELIRSVEAQDYPHIEHIVIDDGSTDDGATVAVLRRHPRVRWWSRENRGQYPTLNEGLRAATGDFVTVISADDAYADSGAIAAMARFLVAHPGTDVVHGYTRHLDADGAPLPVQPYQRYPAWMARYNLGCILHCSMLVRREPVLRHGLFFDETLRYVADADWLIRLYQTNLRFGRIERDIGAYRHHAQQVSTVASGDQSAAVSRLAEHAVVRARYPASRAVQALVAAYDTFQQRRVKAQGAWRAGGAARLFAVSAEWWKRRRS
jgi:glycosyltransferase involved in cell wall biosynthesis